MMVDSSVGGSRKLYGLYSAVCSDISDPQKRGRIKLKNHQIWGDHQSNWAEPCWPVTSNDNHPNHKTHKPKETVSQVQDHVGTFTDSNGDTVTITFKHKPTKIELHHPHVNVTENVYDQIANPHEEHTLHRKVPRLKQVVWVMFQGGDPNYPVWIGVGTG